MSKLKVCKTRCNQCLFSKNKIVSDKRRNEIIKDCVANDKHFVCHKSHRTGDDTVCRGFYETYSTNLIRIMGRLGGIEYVEPASLSPIKVAKEFDEFVPSEN